MGVEDALELCRHPPENLSAFFNLTPYTVHYHCSKLTINMTTCRIIQSQDDIDSIQTICTSADLIWHIGFWAIFIGGLLGNSLALLTIWTLPTSTATLYAGILAASDLCAIPIKATIYLLEANMNFSVGEPTWLWNGAQLLFCFVPTFSNWMLVLICLERYLTVRFPFQKRYVFTIPVARICAIVVGLILFAIYCLCAWRIGFQDPRMSKINNFLYSTLPLLFIVVFIVLISVQLRIIHNKRKTLNVHTSGKSKRQCTVSCDDSHPNNHQSRLLSSPRRTSLEELARLENSMTVMMMLAAVVFSLLTIPLCVVSHLYHDFAMEWNTPVSRANFVLIYKISQLLAFLNLSINFFLYFLINKKFRTQLCKVLTHGPMCLKNKCFKVQSPSFNNTTTADSVLPLQNLRYSVNDHNHLEINGKANSSDPNETSLTALHLNEWSVGEITD